MTKGVSAKHQREDRLRLRRKRLLDASGALQGAKSPGVPAIPSPRLSAGLSAHRQVVAPIGRADK
jgi:hypothetical protein